MNLLNFLLGNLFSFILLLSAIIPPSLFGFFTSTNTKGSPFTNRVISGLNSSSPFLQVNSAVQQKLLFWMFSKSINLIGETETNLL